MVVPTAGLCMVAFTDSLTNYALLAQILEAGYNPISSWSIQSPSLEARGGLEPSYLPSVSPASRIEPAHS